MRTARLPIDEHMQCLQRRVLAVNHVFEMLLHFTQPQGGDWSAAVAQAMPQRRGATLRDTAAPAAAPPLPQAMDADGDGVVDAREFITGIAACCRSPNDDSKLAFCYDAFDTNHDGRLSADEMTIMLRSLWWVNKGSAQGQGWKCGA